MNIYYYVGPGLALGAEIIVAARNKRKANFLAKKWAENNGLSFEHLHLAEHKPLESSCVLHGWNGDY